MRLETGKLTTEDIKDKNNSETKGLNISTNIGGSTVDGEKSKFPSGSTSLGMQSLGNESEQINRATIGNGTIIVGGEEQTEQDLKGLNRDMTNTQEITRDEITGALDTNLTVDNRVFTEEGRKEIVEDIKNLTKNLAGIAVEFKEKAKEVFETLSPKEKKELYLNMEKENELNNIIEKAERMKEKSPEEVKELTEEVNKIYEIDIEKMSMKEKAKKLNELAYQFDGLSENDKKLRDAIYSSLDLDKNYEEFRDKMGEKIIKRLSKDKEIKENIKNFEQGNWEKLSTLDKEKYLQIIVDTMQNVVGNEKRVGVDIKDGKEGNMGVYNNSLKSIDLNSQYVNDYNETIDTIFHEGNHSLQDYMRNDKEYLYNKDLHLQLDIFNSNSQRGQGMYNGGDSSYYYDNPKEVDSWKYGEEMKNKFNDMVDKIKSKTKK